MKDERCYGLRRDIAFERAPLRGFDEILPGEENWGSVADAVGWGSGRTW